MVACQGVIRAGTYRAGNARPLRRTFRFVSLPDPAGVVAIRSPGECRRKGFSKISEKGLDKPDSGIYYIRQLAYANNPLEGQVSAVDLTEAKEGVEYIILDIVTEDAELDAFLFSLGCYSGEPITVVTRRRHSCTVAIKEARYNIDLNLAKAIRI